IVAKRSTRSRSRTSLRWGMRFSAVTRFRSRVGLLGYLVPQRPGHMAALDFGYSQGRESCQRVTPITRGRTNGDKNGCEEEGESCETHGRRCCRRCAEAPRTGVAGARAGPRGDASAGRGEGHEGTTKGEVDAAHGARDRREHRDDEGLADRGRGLL